MRKIMYGMPHNIIFASTDTTTPYKEQPLKVIEGKDIREYDEICRWLLRFHQIVESLTERK